MNTLPTTPEHYSQYITSYGILSVLHVMEYFELEENYEECDKIIKAIKYLEKLLRMPLFTTITKNNIKQVIDTYKEFNIQTNAAKLNESSWLYSIMIIKDIERL